MTENTNTKKLTFLHLTDCHLSKTATVSTIDIKVKLKGVEQQPRSETLRASLCGLAEALKEKGIKLNAVLFSGDGTFQGDPEGQVILRELLLNTLVEVGISRPSQIVATPGNHDIVAKSEPSNSARYELFQRAWIDEDSAVVPFLDGIHKIDQLNFSDHVLEADDHSWAVFPINTANWSQTSLSENDNGGLAQLKQYVDESQNLEIIKALEKLCSHDVARVSKDQMEALRKLVQQTQKGCLKIAVLHHHLLPVNSSEEVKTFADITNLGHFREVLHELGFHIIVHGHKHAAAAYYDAPLPSKSYAESVHPILVVSGGTFGPTGSHPNTPLQLIEIDDLPHAPVCKVMDISTPISGCALKLPEAALTYRLWDDGPSDKGPVSIYGTSIDDVYARAKQTIAKFPERTMVCTINFQSKDEDAFPLTYPHWGNHAEKRDWFRETVKWWQLPASQIETRIPYIHGSRLRRFGGSFDQINRVIKLLREEKATSKAIALIIDPGRDFGEKPFASFCFVQFCLRSNNRLDCIGYYRAQEFHHWWPVNVAELRHLQLDIAREADIEPGEITTISPYPRLSENIRQPTKVAVPLIDQWVDNHPKRIAQIALALASHEGDSHKEGIELWERCLDDFERAATDFHKDGIQVSIEGLRLLIDWLRAASGPDSTIELIGSLLNENVSNQHNLTERKKFDLWKGNVEVILEKLRRISLGPTASPTTSS